MRLSEIQHQPSIEETIEFIKKAHASQTYDGKPYWTHPHGVMKMLPAGSSEDEKHAALLHDVLEDTPTTEDDLREKGYSNETIEIVKLVSKPKGMNMTYMEWIEKTIIGSGNKGAMRVKYADNKFNHDSAGTGLSAEKKKSLMQRYAKSMELLTQAI